MFETSVVRAQAAAARGRFSLLTVSITAHSLVILGAIAASIASTEFPMNAPDEFAQAPTFASVRIPPPLGDPNGGARREARPAQQPQQNPAPVPPQPNQITAPSPDSETRVVEEVPSAGGDAEGPGIPGATSTAPLGVAWGTEGGLGDLDAPPGPVTNTQPEEKIYEVHEVKAPVLLHKVAPDYPDFLRRTRVPATVIVRCIIDKNGHVRDPQVIVGALPPFNAAVLNAVQKWRYTPGSRNGVAVETYLNVTVTFHVK
jgi:periplasmic protein TonB